MKRVAIFISGSGSNMMTLLEDMKEDHPARPALVLSNNPDAAGLQKAAAQGVPTAAVNHRPYGKDRARFEEALTHVLAKYAPDILCLAGFMRILTPGFVDHWRGRMLNIHPSLLPKYPGLNTHQRAIDAGDTEAGCSVHEVIADLDAGPVLGQAHVPIKADDTSESLAARVLKAEHKLYPAVLRRFAAGDRTRLDLPHAR
ncbi:MAG: phosphoribosylglycinamide formyltransferase [Pseudomonadota bacterium]